MEKMDLSNIRNYYNLAAWFAHHDTNHDFKLGKDELLESDITAVDKDGSRTAELWEFMDAINRQRRIELGHLFSRWQVERLKNASQLIPSSAYNQLTSDYSVPLVFSLLIAGLTDPKEMRNTLNVLFPNFSKDLESSWGLLGLASEIPFEGLSNNIQTMREAGINDPKLMIALLKTVDPSSPVLSDVISALQKHNIKDPKRITEYMNTIAQAAEGDPANIYKVLGSILDWNTDLKEIVKLIDTVDKAARPCAPEAYAVLPSILSAGITGLDDIKTLVEAIIFHSSTGEDHIAPADKAIGALSRIEGINPNEIKDILIFLAAKAGDNRTYTYNTLARLLGFMPIIVGKTDELAAFIRKYPEKYSYSDADNSLILKGRMTEEEKAQLLTILKEDSEKTYVEYLYFASKYNLMNLDPKPAPQKIIAFIRTLAEISGQSSGSTFDLIPHLFSAGITDFAYIEDFVRTTINNSNVNSSDFETSMHKTIASLVDFTGGNTEQIKDMLEFCLSQPFADKLFSSIPAAIDTIKSANKDKKTDLDIGSTLSLLKLIATTAKGSCGDYYNNLGALFEAGITSPDSIKSLITGLSLTEKSDLSLSMIMPAYRSIRTFMTKDHKEIISVLIMVNASVIHKENAFKVLPELLEAGLREKRQLLSLLKKVDGTWDNGYMTKGGYDTLMVALNSLKRARKDIETVRKNLEQIATEFGTWTSVAYGLIPTLIDNKTTAMPEILSALRTINKSDGSSALSSFFSAGITDLNEIQSVLNSISRNAKGRSSEAISAIPEALDAIAWGVKAGKIGSLKTRSDICDLLVMISRTAKTNTAEAFKALPVILAAGITSPQEITGLFRMINNIHIPENHGYENIYNNVAKAISSLTEHTLYISTDTVDLKGFLHLYGYKYSKQYSTLTVRGAMTKAEKDALIKFYPDKKEEIEKLFAESANSMNAADIRSLLETVKKSSGRNTFWAYSYLTLAINAARENLGIYDPLKLKEVLLLITARSKEGTGAIFENLGKNITSIRGVYSSEKIDTGGTSGPIGGKSTSDSKAYEIRTTAERGKFDLFLPTGSLIASIDNASTLDEKIFSKEERSMINAAKERLRNAEFPLDARQIIDLLLATIDITGEDAPNAIPSLSGMLQMFGDVEKVKTALRKIVEAYNDKSKTALGNAGRLAAAVGSMKIDGPGREDLFFDIIRETPSVLLNTNAPSLMAAGLGPEDAVEILVELERHKDDHGYNASMYDTCNSLIYAVETIKKNGITDPSHIKELIMLAPVSGQENSTGLVTQKAYFDAISQLFDTLKLLGITDLKGIKAIISSVRSFEKVDAVSFESVEKIKDFIRKYPGKYMFDDASGTLSVRGKMTKDEAKELSRLFSWGYMSDPVDHFYECSRTPGQSCQLELPKNSIVPELDRMLSVAQVLKDEAGITDPKAIIEIISAINASENSDSAFSFIGKAIKGIKNKRINDPKIIKDVLIAIASAARKNTSTIFMLLPYDFFSKVDLQDVRSEATTTVKNVKYRVTLTPEAKYEVFIGDETYATATFNDIDEERSYSISEEQMEIVKPLMIKLENMKRMMSPFSSIDPKYNMAIFKVLPVLISAGITDLKNIEVIISGLIPSGNDYGDRSDAFSSLIPAIGALKKIGLHGQNMASFLKTVSDKTGTQTSAVYSSIPEIVASLPDKDTSELILGSLWDTGSSPSVSLCISLPDFINILKAKGGIPRSSITGNETVWNAISSRLDVFFTNPLSDKEPLMPKADINDIIPREIEDEETRKSFKAMIDQYCSGIMSLDDCIDVLRDIEKGSPSVTLGNLAAALRAIYSIEGFDKYDAREKTGYIKNMLTAVIKGCGPGSDNVFSGLGTAITALRSMGIKDLLTTRQWLYELIDIGQGYTHILFNCLPAIASAGVTDLNTLSRIFTAVGSASKDKKEGAFYRLKDAVEAVAKSEKFRMLPSAGERTGYLKEILIAAAGAAQEDIEIIYEKFSFFITAEPGDRNGLRSLSDPHTLEELLNTVARDTKYKKSAYKALPAIVSAGITDVKDIHELIIASDKNGIGKVEYDWSSEPTYYYEHLEKAITELSNIEQVKGLSEKERAAYIKSIVLNIIISTETGSSSAFDSLPGAVEGIQKAGLKDRERIRNMLEFIAASKKKGTSEIYKQLPDIVSAGITDPAAICEFISAISETAGTNAGQSIGSLGGACIAARDAGLSSPVEILDFLKKISQAAGEQTSSRFSSLAAAVDSMRKRMISEKFLKFDPSTSSLPGLYSKFNYDYSSKSLSIKGVMTIEERDTLLKCVSTEEDKKAVERMYQRSQASAMATMDVIPLLEKVAVIAGANKESIFNFIGNFASSYGDLAPDELLVRFNNLLPLLPYMLFREINTEDKIFRGLDLYERDMTSLFAFQSDCEKLEGLAAAAGDEFYDLRKDLNENRPSQSELRTCFSYNFAAALNDYLSSNKSNRNKCEEMAKMASLTINRFTDFFKEKYPATIIPNRFDCDLIRRQACAALSTRSCYNIITFSGADLTIYSFKEIVKRMKNDPNLINELNIIEQEEKKAGTANFTRFLTNFLELGGMRVAGHYDYFFGKIFGILDREKDVMEHGLHLTSAFERLITCPDEYDRDLEAAQQRLIEYKGAIDDEGYKALNGLVRQARKNWQDGKEETGMRFHYKRLLETMLIKKWHEQYTLYTGNKSNDTDKLKLLSYWIIAFQKYFTDGALKNAASGIKDLFSKDIPIPFFDSSWLEDGTIRGKVFLFSGHDIQLELCQSTGGTDRYKFGKGLGYHINSIIYNDKTRLEFTYEKGKIYAVKVTWKRDENYKDVEVRSDPVEVRMDKNQRSDDLYIKWPGDKKWSLLVTDQRMPHMAVLEKEMPNGNKVELILQLEDEGIGGDQMRDPKELEVIFQRGHFFEKRVFPKLDSPAPKRLYGLFGCGAAKPATSLYLKNLGNYENAMIFGDSDGAHGYVSNIYIAKSLEALASVKGPMMITIDGLRRYLQREISTFNSDGIILPDSPFLQFEGYIKDMALPEGKIAAPALPALPEPPKEQSQIRAGTFNISRTVKLPAVEIDADEARLIRQVTDDPQMQAEIALTIYFETKLGRLRDAYKSLYSTLSGKVYSYGPAQLRFTNMVKLYPDFFASLSSDKADALPEGRKFMARLRELNKGKPSDANADDGVRECYIQYMGTLEGAVVGAFLFCRNLRDQLETNYKQCNKLDWDLNLHLIQDSTAYRIALYAGYCSNIKTQMMISQEFKLWAIAREYGFEPKDPPIDRLKKEIEQRIKAKKPTFDLELEEAFIDGIGNDTTVETVKKILEKHGCTVSDRKKTRIERADNGRVMLDRSTINIGDIQDGFLDGKLTMEAMREGPAAEMIDQVYRDLFRKHPPLFFSAEVFRGSIASSDIPQDLRSDNSLMSAIFKNPGQSNLVPKIRSGELESMLGIRPIDDARKKLLISLFKRAEKASSIRSVNRGLQMTTCLPRLMEAWNVQPAAK